MIALSPKRSIDDNTVKSSVCELIQQLHGFTGSRYQVQESDISSFLCGPISLLVASKPVMKRLRTTREAMAALWSAGKMTALSGPSDCTFTSATSPWLSKRMKSASVRCGSDLCISRLSRMSCEILHTQARSNMCCRTVQARISARRIFHCQRRSVQTKTLVSQSTPQL